MTVGVLGVGRFAIGLLLAMIAASRRVDLRDAITQIRNALTYAIVGFSVVMADDHGACGDRDDYVMDAGQPLQGILDLRGAGGAVHALDTESDFRGLYKVAHDRHPKSLLRTPSFEFMSCPPCRRRL